MRFQFHRQSSNVVGAANVDSRPITTHGKPAFLILCKLDNDEDLGDSFDSPYTPSFLGIEVCNPVTLLEVLQPIRVQHMVILHVTPIPDIRRYPGRN